MKQIMIILVMLIFFTTFVSSLEVPDESNTIVINKIDSEHKNTRQFLTDQMNKMKNDGIKEFTTRGDYYEQAYRDITNTFLVKLGFLWLGILIFVVSINRLIQNRTEKKKYDLLKKSLKIDIVNEFYKDSVLVPRPPSLVDTGEIEKQKSEKLKRNIDELGTALESHKENKHEPQKKSFFDKFKKDKQPEPQKETRIMPEVVYQQDIVLNQEKQEPDEDEFDRRVREMQELRELKLLRGQSNGYQ